MQFMSIKIILQLMLQHFVKSLQIQVELELYMFTSEIIKYREISIIVVLLQ